MFSPVFQTVFTDAEKGVIGNCRAACFSSLTGIPIEEIPFEKEPCLRVLQTHGYSAYFFEGRPPCDGSVYVACYTMARRHHKGTEIGHCVLWRNGRVVHNPRPRPARPRLVKLDGYFEVVKLSKPYRIVAR